MDDEQKAKFAAELSAAVMREYLAKQGEGQAFKAPRLPDWRKAVALNLAAGVTDAEEVAEFARNLEDSARNAGESVGARFQEESPRVVVPLAAPASEPPGAPACPVCGGPVTGTKPNAVYCGDKCRKAAWRARKRDQAA